MTAQFPGHRWGDGASDHIALLEGLLKIIGNHAANFLCLQVIGIVVAVRQHVGANHDATLDLITKTFGAGYLVHVNQVGVLVGAMTKLHPVKAAQVAGRLGWRDDVVHRDG